MGRVGGLKLALCLGTVLCIAGSVPTGAQQNSGPRPSPGSTLFERLSATIISVETFEQDRSQPTRRGTAVLVFGENVAVTNAHVLLNASRVLVRTGKGRVADAKVAYADVDRDVALLIPADDLAEPRRDFPISGEEPAIGTHVYAISNPLGMDRSLTEGIVSSIRKFQGLGQVVQHTAAISPGSSGGALFDDSGTLVGIVTGQLPQGQSLNFAITSQTIRDALMQWAEADMVETTKLSPSEYVAGTRRRFPEFAGLSDRELLDEISKRRPDQSGLPPALRRLGDISPLEVFVRRIDEIFSRYRDEAERLLNGLSQGAGAALVTEIGRRLQLLYATTAPTQRSKDALAILINACESIQRRLTADGAQSLQAAEVEVILRELRQQSEAFSMLAEEADVQSIGGELRSTIQGYVRGFRDQISLFEKMRVSLASNPEGTWIDDGGLESRARVPVPPVTIAVGRDGTYYVTAGTENVSTQDISYLVNAQLRRSATRFSGTITVRYYMRSASESHACSSSGTLDVVLSADGKLLSGTSVLSRQPDSVPAPFALLCSALPSGTRAIRLTRQ